MTKKVRTIDLDEVTRVLVTEDALSFQGRSVDGETWLPAGTYKITRSAAIELYQAIAQNMIIE